MSEKPSLKDLQYATQLSSTIREDPSSERLDLNHSSNKTLDNIAVDLELQLKNASSVQTGNPKETAKTNDPADFEAIPHKPSFVYIVKKTIPLNWKKVVYTTLILYLAEYIILLAFQVISFSILNQFWKGLPLIIPIASGSVYLSVKVCFYAAQKCQSRWLSVVFKILEFILEAILLCWAAICWDFSFLATSYIASGAILLMIGSVC